MNYDSLKSKKILVILGYAGAGKDTVANMILDSIGSPRPHAFRFSQTLKEVAELVFGWPAAALGEFKYKEEDLTEPLFRADHSVIRNRREALQYIGTELFRTMDADVWIKAALRRANGQANIFDCSGFIATDCRFPNELDALKKHFGEVKVVRMVKVGGEQTALQANGQPHASERHIAEFPVDKQFTLDAGDFDGLRAVASQLRGYFA